MVHGSKTQKIILDSHGSYLGMEKGAFTVKDKEGNIQRYPLFEKEIGEVILKSGNFRDFYYFIGFQFLFLYF